MVLTKSEIEKKAVIATGHPDIDRKMGGGIPLGSLTLIESQPDSGKSVLCERIIWEALTGGCKVILFSTENTVKSFVNHMESLGLDVLDYLLLGRLKVFHMEPSQVGVFPAAAFDAIAATIDRNETYRLVIVDYLEPIMFAPEELKVMNYFERCKTICSRGRTIVNVTQTYGLDNETLTQVRSAADTRFKLSIDKAGEKPVEVLEVAGMKDASQDTQNVIAFDAAPEAGIVKAGS